MKQEQTQKAQLNKEQREEIENVVREMRRKVEKNIEHRLKTEQDLESKPEEPDGSRKKLANAVKREKDEDESWEKALDDYIKGVGYTVVNRLTALRSMEVRGFIDREVTQFKGAKTPAAEPIIQDEYEKEQEATLKAYHRECEELSEDIQILFDTDSPYNLVDPDYDVYKDLCETLDEIDDSLWLADDVLGWVYEYYNADDLEEVREKAREEGLDAEDTTIANQFYTPHWVVRMLTDNSLGKLYLEENNKLLSAIDEQENLSIEERQERSTHPSDTPRVEDLCTYLVPTKEEGESTNYDDPSEIRVIDPACGSGHFLLYAFDILERIWRDETNISREKIPAKILENNIYGVDLDLRACQLASFNLYLKARTRAEDEGAENFQMPEVGIVCSDSSISNLEEAEEVFEEVAGEEPKIEETLEEILEEFQEIEGLGSLLDVRSSLKEHFIQNDQSDLLDFEDSDHASLNSFLNKLHDKIEEKHSNGKFLAQDLQSFLRLVKILSQKYDVSLMNPPYGSKGRMPDPVQDYVEKHYDHYPNYYINFYEIGSRLSKKEGRIGMLIPASFMLSTRLKEFREEFILGNTPFDFLSEFGYEILDNATVRTVGTVVRNSKADNKTGTFMRLHDLDKGEKENGLLRSITKNTEDIKRLFSVELEKFAKIPGSRISYWTPETILDLHGRELKIDPQAPNLDVEGKGIGKAKTGIQTDNNPRFVRKHWEVNNLEDYMPFAKGGSNPWIIAQTNLKVNWGDSALEIERATQSSITNKDYFGREGLTWSRKKRSGRRFGFLNSGAAFDSTGSMIFIEDYDLTYDKLLAAINSNLYHSLFLSLTPTRSWEVGEVGRLPWLKELEELDNLEDYSKEQRSLKLIEKSYDITSPYFTGPRILKNSEPFFKDHEFGREFSREAIDEKDTIKELVAEAEKEKIERKQRIEELADEIDNSIYNALDISKDTIKQIESEIWLRTIESPEDREYFMPEGEELYRNQEKYIKQLIHHFVLTSVQEDNIITISKESDDEDSDLMDHVVEKFEDFWGEYADERLAEADQILGDERSGEEAYPNIRSWLENDLFEFHLREFENTPILWKITTERMVQEPKSQGFACIVDYHQLDSGIFDKLKNLMEPRKSALRENRKDADRRRSDGSLSADEQSKAVEEYERCDDALRQIDEFESTIRELGQDNPRDWSKEDQKLAENLVPKVREFRTRTKKRLKTLDQLREEADEDWLEDMFTPTFFDRVDENREEWIDALQDLEKACKEYTKDSSEPVKAHLFDLFVYFQGIAGSTSYNSNDITFMNYYFSEGDRFLDNGEPREGLNGKEKLMADLASETDEDVELAKEIKDICSEIESQVSSDWKDRAIEEVTVEGYTPVKKHGVAINIEPLAEKSIVPEIVEDKVI